MAGWSGRIRFVEGEEGRAFRPGELLVRGTLRQLVDAGNFLEHPFLVRDPEERDLDPEAVLPPDVEVAEPWSRTAQGFFKLSDYGGDVTAAVVELRARGLLAQHNHVFFANSYYADTLHGNPAYGNPAYGNPAYGNPAYGNPAYGNPAYGNPAYGNPAYGNPAYGNPRWGGHADGCGCGAPTGCECKSKIDRCLIEQHRGPVGLVHPSPILARYYLSEQSARRYQLTGVRPSTAVPLQSVDAELPDNGEWAEGSIRVAVIDTGWPMEKADTGTDSDKNEAFDVAPKPAAWHPQDPEREDYGDRPDVEGNEFLDPASGHGMFIAGVIQRYAPTVAVKVVKALTTYGDGSESDIAEQIDELVDADVRPHIINLSLGTYAPEEPDLLAGAVRNAIAEGIVVVASAGNDGTSRKQYPAAYPGVVSVGALGRYGPAPFSNWGSWVRASAPGVDIASGFWTFESKTVLGLEPDRFENWALWSGTSFAAPIVAAALVRTMRQDECDANEAVRRTIDNPCLARLPCYGTIVNPPCDLDLP